MKKIFSTLAVFAFLILSHLLNPTTTTRAATLCCPNGYTPQNGQCLNAKIAPVCTSLALGICGNPVTTAICTAIPQIPQTISSSCRTIVTSSGASSIPTFCASLLSSVSSLLPTEVSAGFINLCVTVAATSGLGNLGAIVSQPSNCNATSGGFGFCYIDGDPLKQGVSTAFGCLDITGANTIRALLGWSIGIAGGIAFLSIVYAGFLIVTSQGDPKKSQSGKEMITSSIAGLFLILAAVVVLNFIGLNILGLGNLGFDV